jgi:hypothetical protein
MATGDNYQGAGFRPFGRYNGWAGWPERFIFR